MWYNSMQMQILVDKIIINWIYLKHKQMSSQTVQTNSFSFLEQLEQAKNVLN